MLTFFRARKCFLRQTGKWWFEIQTRHIQWQVRKECLSRLCAGRSAFLCLYTRALTDWTEVCKMLTRSWDEQMRRKERGVSVERLAHPVKSSFCVGCPSSSFCSPTFFLSLGLSLTYCSFKYVNIQVHVTNIVCVTVNKYNWIELVAFVSSFPN